MTSKPLPTPSSSTHLPLAPTLEILQLNSVSFDGDTSTLLVNAKVADTRFPGAPSIDHSFEINLHADTEMAVRVREMVNLALQRAHVPVVTHRQVRCSACQSACCTTYEMVVVYEEDIPALLHATGLSQRAELYTAGVLAHGPINGAAGYLGRLASTKEVKAETDADTHCVFLTWDKQGVGRCSIYEDRPRTCREYRESSCTVQKDPAPKLYKIRPASPRKGPPGLPVMSPLFDMHHFLLTNMQSQE